PGKDGFAQAVAHDERMVDPVHLDRGGARNRRFQADPDQFAPRAGEFAGRRKVAREAGAAYDTRPKPAPKDTNTVGRGRARDAGYEFQLIAIESGSDESLPRVAAPTRVANRGFDIRRREPHPPAGADRESNLC